MHGKRLMYTVIAACGILLAGGSAAAAVERPAVAAVSAPSDTSGGNVYFTAYQNDDLPGETAVLSGAIGDFGEAVSVLPDGSVDPEHSSQLRLALTQGSFRILVGPLHEQLVTALATSTYSLTTCSGDASVSGAAPIVTGSGTGAYKGITGTMTLTITVNEVDAKPGCQPFSGSPLIAQSIVIAGTGTVSLPSVQ